MIRYPLALLLFILPAALAQGQSKYFRYVGSVGAAVAWQGSELWRPGRLQLLIS
jgi:hypothetical protein